LKLFFEFKSIESFCFNDLHKTETWTTLVSLLQNIFFSLNMNWPESAVLLFLKIFISLTVLDGSRDLRFPTQRNRQLRFWVFSGTAEHYMQDNPWFSFHFLKTIGFSFHLLKVIKFSFHPLKTIGFSFHLLMTTGFSFLQTSRRVSHGIFIQSQFSYTKSVKFWPDFICILHRDPSLWRQKLTLSHQLYRHKHTYIDLVVQFWCLSVPWVVY